MEATAAEEANGAVEDGTKKKKKRQEEAEVRGRVGIGGAAHTFQEELGVAPSTRREFRAAPPAGNNSA